MSIRNYITLKNTIGMLSVLGILGAAAYHYYYGFTSLNAKLTTQNVPIPNKPVVQPNKQVKKVVTHNDKPQNQKHVTPPKAIIVIDKEVNVLNLVEVKRGENNVMICDQVGAHNQLADFLKDKIQERLELPQAEINRNKLLACCEGIISKLNNQLLSDAATVSKKAMHEGFELLDHNSGVVENYTMHITFGKKADAITISKCTIKLKDRNL